MTRPRRRLDVELVRRGLAGSRAEARTLVERGEVLVAGAVAERTSRQVAPDEAVVVTAPARFVSRGGDKLDAAMESFGVSAQRRRALDAGASTGGFTDCLLQRGAREVVAVDVGHGQLHERLRRDDRVQLRERTNVRGIEVGDLGGPVDLVVADLSFISLRTVAPALVGVCRPGADLVVLIKPQFEAGRKEVSRGRGVVRDPDVHCRVLRDVLVAWKALGADIMGVMRSPITGADGNVEYLAHLRAPRDPGRGAP